MKSPKGTKGRKPKPHSKGGKRAAVAKAAHRPAPKDRGEHSRAEIKRAAAKKAAGRTSGANAPGARVPSARKLPVKRYGSRGRRIDADLPGAEGGPAASPGSPQPGQEASRPRSRRGAQEPLSAADPLIAIVGRPNVGKSTLFNRLTGSRRSIVGDEPGITRDRIYGEVEWLGRRARVVDTGGIVPHDQAHIPSEIFRQARFALEEAAFAVMVVDGRAPLTAPDYELARLLFESGKPLLLAVNKMDSAQTEERLDEYRRLGIRNIVPISSEHSIGVGELLDEVFAALPISPAIAPTTSGDQGEAERPTPQEAEGAEEEEQAAADGVHRTHGEYQQREISVAIIGRPNVGKSTLLNVLTGSSRAIVSPVAGTTRDAVDEVIEYDGAQVRFIDTAGIRRKGKTKEMAEKLSVVMARRHLEAADVALLIIDAAEGVTASDATIGGYAHESGRSVIVVVNKWDLVTTGRRDGKPPASKEIFEQQVRSALKYLSYAPVVFVSASEGKNIHTVLKLVREVAAERRKRITTGQMNRFLEQVDFQRATVPMANKVRIYYMTQAAVAPPTFILFTNRKVKLHFSFERFLENQIRAAFGFRGSPIWFKVRAREDSKPPR